MEHRKQYDTLLVGPYSKIKLGLEDDDDQCDEHIIISCWYFARVYTTYPEWQSVNENRKRRPSACAGTETLPTFPRVKLVSLLTGARQQLAI